MNKQYNLTVTKVDNGFIVRSRPDDRQGQELVAKDEKEVQDAMAEVAAHLFDPVPEKVKPGASTL